MKTNEDDINSAYERAVNRERLLACAEEILRRGLADQSRDRL